MIRGTTIALGTDGILPGMARDGAGVGTAGTGVGAVFMPDSAIPGTTADGMIHGMGLLTGTAEVTGVVATGVAVIGDILPDITKIRADITATGALPLQENTLPAGMDRTEGLQIQAVLPWEPVTVHHCEAAAVPVQP